MVPVELKRTMAARLVQSAAGPLDRPIAAFVLAVAAVASNCASKASVCVGTGLFRQIPALVKQLGAVTEMAAVPLLPSLVAVIVAVPVATPVTRPLAATVATALLLFVHVTDRPVSVFPAESWVTAASCTVAPTATLVDAGFTVTAATGTLLLVTVGATIATSVMLFQALWPFPWPTMRT